jgi:hypothetical protein
MLRPGIFCAVAFSLFFTSQTFGTIITYDIAGAGLPLGPKSPFNISIPSGASITGGFAYDTNVSPIEIQSMIGTTPVTTAWYLQTIAGGLSVNVGGKVFIADSYAITVTNDSPSTPSNPTLFDTVTVIYSNAAPISVQPTSPLEHNGNPLGSAQLLLTFRAPASLLPNRSIPYPLVWSQFTSARSFLLNDTTQPLQLVSGTITSLVPEPGTALLLASGMLFATVRRRKSRFSTTVA